MNIEGSTVVVTGGGSGIGKGLCERFASLGAAHVVVADINVEAAEAVAASVGGSAVRVDVADDISVRSMIDNAIEAAGHVDLFCANAGIGAGGGLDTSDDVWERSLQINAMGVVRCARAVIPHMIERGGGGFLITASAAGLITGPTSFNYAISKHAAMGVAEWLSIHYPSITVQALCPTVVDTPMISEFGEVLMEPLTVEQVVDATIAVESGTFLITPSEISRNMVQSKTADYDGIFAGMRGQLAAIDRLYGS